MASPVTNLGHRTGELSNTRISAQYDAVRGLSETLIEPLSAEDACVQSMPDASPVKWHLAHVTWFFETFVLEPHETGFKPFNPAFRELFNSYYNSVGEPFPRPRRGLLTRPTVAEIFEYRDAVDERMSRLLNNVGGEDQREIARIVELGINHEQQHQELMLTDIKHVFSCNPLWPAYRELPVDDSPSSTAPGRWVGFRGGVVEIGHEGESFAFDNERPRHKVFLQPFELHDRLVTKGEYLEFMKDGGYQRPDLWLSLGW